MDDVDARQERVALLGRHVGAVRPRFYRDHRIIRQYVKFLTVELVLPPPAALFQHACAPSEPRAMGSCSSANLAEREHSAMAHRGGDEGQVFAIERKQELALVV